MFYSKRSGKIQQVLLIFGIIIFAAVFTLASHSNYNKAKAVSAHPASATAKVTNKFLQSNGKSTNYDITYAFMATGGPNIR